MVSLGNNDYPYESIHLNFGGGEVSIQSVKLETPTMVLWALESLTSKGHIKIFPTLPRTIRSKPYLSLKKTNTYYGKLTTHMAFCEGRIVQ